MLNLGNQGGCPGGPGWKEQDEMKGLTGKIGIGDVASEVANALRNQAGGLESVAKGLEVLSEGNQSGCVRRRCSQGPC